MRIAYDKVADALAIWFDGVTSTRTLDVTESILVDVDEEGRLAGIEVLHASEKASLTSLLSITLDFSGKDRVELKLPKLLSQM